MLVRTVECIQGRVQVEMVCEPMLQYGSKPATWTHAESDRGGRHARWTQATASGPSASTPTCGWASRATGHTAGTRWSRASGASARCPGRVDRDGPARRRAGLQGQLADTEHYWRTWIAEGTYPDHPWRYHLQRSALALKGLTFMPTGALVAAATTSLPETPRGSRNWDYRYCWMRDATFTLWALHALGLDWEADDFVQYVADLERNEDGVAADHVRHRRRARTSAESTLDHLNGYEGARPVRIGNGAYDQRQNDVYGAVLDSVYLHSKNRDHIPERLWPILDDQVTCASRVWCEPDQGIWEARGEPKHYVSSKLMCWVAIDRGARLAERRGEQEHAQRLQKLADEVKAEILEKGVDERGVFRQHYDTDALDASSLLVPLVRFLPASDERVRATVSAIKEELTENGLVLRYRTAETDDGQKGEEGSFLICSFWLVSALCEIGELREAEHLCERLLTYASPLGLYAEELDPPQGATSATTRRRSRTWRLSMPSCT